VTLTVTEGLAALLCGFSQSPPDPSKQSGEIPITPIHPAAKTDKKTPFADRFSLTILATCRPHGLFCGFHLAYFPISTYEQAANPMLPGNLPVPGSYLRVSSGVSKCRLFLQSTWRIFSGLPLNAGAWLELSLRVSA